MNALIHKVGAQMPKFRKRGQVVSEPRGHTTCGGLLTVRSPDQCHRKLDALTKPISRAVHLVPHCIIGL